MELCAPTGSFAFKTSSKATNNQTSYDDSTHQFTFSHVFGEQTTQKEFFDSTMLPFVTDIFSGHNGLVFTYGVTNSGKVRRRFLDSELCLTNPDRLDLVGLGQEWSAHVASHFCVRLCFLSKWHGMMPKLGKGMNFVLSVS